MMENNNKTDDNILVWPEDQMPKLSKREQKRLKFLNKWGWAFNPQSRKKHREFVKNQKLHQKKMKRAWDKFITGMLYDWGFYDDDQAMPNRHDADDLVYVYPPEIPDDEMHKHILLTDEVRAQLTPAEQDAIINPRRAADLDIKLTEQELNDFLAAQGLDDDAGMVTIIRPLDQDGVQALEEILEMFQAMKKGDENGMLTQSEVDEVLAQYEARHAAKDGDQANPDGLVTPKKSHLATEFREDTPPVKYELDRSKMFDHYYPYLQRLY